MREGQTRTQPRPTRVTWSNPVVAPSTNAVHTHTWKSSEGGAIDVYIRTRVLPNAGHMSCPVHHSSVMTPPELFRCHSGVSTSGWSVMPLIAAPNVAPGGAPAAAAAAVVRAWRC
jgi:hypothetical protein